jgi:carnitine O-palmitoyltransferase 1
MTWLFLVRLLEGFGKPMTYSFQRVLPTLPVPALRDTCRRYLESARPLLDDAEYDRMCRLAEEFQQNEGRGFQRWLNVKSWYVDGFDRHALAA